MDDYLLHELGRSLYSLERNGAGLEELLTFHRGSSTDIPGRAVMVLWARCLTGSQLRQLGCSGIWMWWIVCRGVR